MPALSASDNTRYLGDAYRLMANAAEACRLDGVLRNYGEFVTNALRLKHDALVATERGQITEKEFTDFSEELTKFILTETPSSLAMQLGSSCRIPGYD